jgi:hypothetical protein
MTSAFGASGTGTALSAAVSRRRTANGAAGAVEHQAVELAAGERGRPRFEYGGHVAGCVSSVAERPARGQ